MGLISSTYSAAGSALTSLTTTFTIDILDGRKNYNEEHLTTLRKWVHIAMAVVMMLFVLAFHLIGEGSVINLVFKIAGYTYGPILGMFMFGLMTRRQMRGKYIALIAVLSPVASYLLQWWTARQFEYYIGFELLGYNALFTIFGLFLISKSQKNETK